MMFSPWHLLGIAAFGGWLGLALLIAWVAGRWARPMRTRSPASV
jgi:hypothetical protein